MTAPPAVATNELVAAAWLRTVPGVGNAGHTLPRDVTTWATTGFVQAVTSGGSSSIYLPMHTPAVRIDCWAASATSGRPPWGKANALAEAIRTACLNHPAFPVAVTLPGSLRARVHTAYLLGEPQRVPDDIASCARYTFPLALGWVAT